MFAKKILIALLIITIATSCGISSDDKFPGIDIPMAEMNQAFIVEDPPVMANSHRNNEALILQLKNKSETRIVLPDNYGIKIFKKDGPNWILIENNQGYSSGETILQTSKEFPPGLLPDVTPFIIDLKKPETIRVVFVGHYDSSDATMVGAYIELTLYP